MTTPPNVPLKSFAIGNSAACGDENLCHAEPTDPRLIHSQINQPTAGEHNHPEITVIISNHVAGLRSGNENMSMINGLGREELGQEKIAERDYTLLGAIVKFLTCLLPLGFIAIFCAANLGVSGLCLAFRVSSTFLAILGLIVGLVVLLVSRITGEHAARTLDGSVFKALGRIAIACVITFALAATALSIKVLIYESLSVGVTRWDWAAFLTGLVNIFTALSAVAAYYMSYLCPSLATSTPSILLYSALPLVFMVVPHLSFNVVFGRTF